MGLGSLFRDLLNSARRFGCDRRANAAMMFGLSLVALLPAVSVGIDFARGVMLHQQMLSALDAAALAVGNTSSKPTSCASAATSQACQDIQTKAQQLFDQSFKTNSSINTGDTTPTVGIQIQNQQVTLKASAPLTLSLLGISGLKSLVTPPTVSASSTVVWGQTKLWVALALDNSGSMSQGDSGGSKMDALQDAMTNSTYGLLQILQAAAANDGDVQVGIVPFTRSVNTGIANTSHFLDWGEWEAPPANVITPSSSVGPGDSCPWKTSTVGYGCLNNSSNSSGTTSTIPSSSGLICPGIDNGNKNGDHNDRYYNGCYTSVGKSTTTTGSPSTNSLCSRSSSCTTSNYCHNYPKTSTTTSGHTTTVTTTSCECSGSNNNKECSTTATPQITAITYTHVWTPNNHSTWSGCVMDRQQLNKSTWTFNGTIGVARTASAHDYDTSNTAPNDNLSVWDDSQFPAENPASCPAATVTTLGYAWTSLAQQVNDMKANGSTNQAIGVEHAFQLLTTGAPYGTGALPDGTTKVLIVFSDGLNTQDRWYGDGSTEGTADDTLIDNRMNAACTAAKNAQIVVYAIFIHIGTSGNSAPLKNCASDPVANYYDLTASSQIKTAFSDIAQKITNLRVSQ